MSSGSFPGGLPPVYHVGSGVLVDSSGFVIPLSAGNNVFDDIYVDRIYDKAGTGAPNFPTGAVIDTGGLTVTAGGITVTAGNVLLSNGTLTVLHAAGGNSIITDGVITTSAGVTVTAGGITVTGGSSFTGGTVIFTDTAPISEGAGRANFATGCAGTPTAPVAISTAGASSGSTAATTKFKGVYRLTVSVSNITTGNGFQVNIPNASVTANMVVKYWQGVASDDDLLPVKGFTTAGVISIYHTNVTAPDATVGNQYIVYWEVENWS
jgi:hypothetical protein